MKKKILHFLRDWWLLSTILLLILIAITLHLAGFRIGPNLSIARVGTIVIENVPQTASIYVDEDFNRKSAGGTEELHVIPGNHQIIVSIQGDYPWSENVVVSSDTKTTIKPLMVSMTPSLKSVDNAGIGAAASLVSKTHLPTAATPLSMSGGCALVSVSGNRIIADATTTATCTPPPYLCTDGTCGSTILFAPTEPLRSLVAYPDRDDMVIMVVGNKAYVLELDPTYPEFLAPLASQSVQKAVVDENGDVILYLGTRFLILDL